MNAEKIRHHIEHLQKLHDDMAKQIDDDYKHFKEDRLVSELKKKKLALKDEIEGFKAQIEVLESK